MFETREPKEFVGFLCQSGQETFVKREHYLRARKF